MWGSSGCPFDIASIDGKKNLAFLKGKETIGQSEWPTGIISFGGAVRAFEGGRRIWRLHDEPLSGNS